MNKVNETDILIDKSWEIFDELKKNDASSCGFTTISEKIKVCECGTLDGVSVENYHTLCIDCGTIFSYENISLEPEWNMYNEDGVYTNSMIRCGNVVDPLFPSNSLTTLIAGKNDLSKWSLRLALTPDEKILLRVKLSVIRICNINCIPIKGNVDAILKLYKTFYNKEDAIKNKGNVRVGIIAVCFYIIVNNNGNLINEHSVSEMFNINHSVFSKCCKIFTEYTKIPMNLINGTENTVESMVDSFTNQLNLDMKVKKLILGLVTICKGIQLFQSFSNKSLVCSVIHYVNLSLKIGKNDEKIHSICNIGKSTMIRISGIIKTNELLLLNKMKNEK